MYVAKIKALISWAVTTQLICVFVYAHARLGFLMTTRTKVSNPLLLHDKNSNILIVLNWRATEMFAKLLLIWIKKADTNTNSETDNS